jgi:hypothetical protein
MVEVGRARQRIDFRILVDGDDAEPLLREQGGKHRADRTKPDDQHIASCRHG